MFANASRRSRAHVDVPLILMVFAMCFFGIYAICVATYSINSTATNLLEHILESSSTLRQCFFVLVLAPLVMTLIILCPYHLIRRFTRAMYIGTTVLVLVVWVFNRAEGVKAWLDIIWDMTIQPSEFIKLAMILMLAQRLSQSEHPMSTFRDFIEIMAMLLVPCAIVLFSGETGSAIVVVFAFACMLLFANVRWRLLITMAVVAILLVLALYGFMVATGSDDYRLARIVAFLNPDLSPQGDAYQMRQSQMTIGAGGLTGIGTFVDGSMSQLNYVPADWTDFIFATIGEAFGFVGCSIIMLWYLAIILRDALPRALHLRSAGYAHHHRRDWHAALPRFREHRHDAGAAADYRHSPAVPLLWRFKHGHEHRRHCAGAECDEEPSADAD